MEVGVLVYLQDRLAGFDDLFQQFLPRRTVGDSVLPLKGYSSKSLGREDDYVDAHFGREYRSRKFRRHPALEVATRAFLLPIDYDPPTEGTP